MAKAYVATHEGNYSDIVLGRVIPGGDTGWNFEEVMMPWTVDANGVGTIKAGLVVKQDGTPLATAAEAADAYGVVVDRKTLPGAEQFNNGALEADVEVPIVIAVRGVTLNFFKLHTADGVVITDAVANVLSQNANQVTKRVVGTDFIGSIV